MKQKAGASLVLLLFVNADANSNPSAVNGSSPLKRGNLRVAIIINSL
jgi:hypothetical protein